MFDAELDAVDPALARSFMRLASPLAGAQQLEHVIRAGAPSMTTWIEAALETGHFDVRDPQEPVPAGKHMTRCAPANRALWLFMTTNQVNPDLGDDPPALGRHGSRRPAPVAGIESLLERIAERIDASVHQYREITGHPPHPGTLFDNLRSVLGCAIAFDHAPLVERLVQRLSTHGGEISTYGLLPGWIVTGHYDERRGHVLLNPAAVALHFGAEQSLARVLSSPQDVLSYAANAYRDDPIDDDELSMAQVLHEELTNVNARCLALICEQLEQRDLSDDECQRMGYFAGDLALKVSSAHDWGRAVIESGLVRVAPEPIFYRAALLFETDVLEATKDSVDWETVYGPWGHPVFSAASSTPSPKVMVEKDASDRAVAWFINEARQRGAAAVHHLFTSVKAGDHPLSEELIRDKRYGLLQLAMEAGLDPHYKDLGKDVPCAMESAQLHGDHTAEALIRASLARRAADASLRELSQEAGLRP